jgi:nicotinamide riboside kinase
MAFTFSANSISDVEKREFANLVSRFAREYDVVIYVSPEGVEIEDNGVRTIDAKYRDSIDNAIKLMLNEWPPVKLIEIKGTTEERIETIKGALFS